ncbi:hypothetical protein V6Z11_A06G019200 [Gossypium hirsutum]
MLSLSHFLSAPSLARDWSPDHHDTGAPPSQAQSPATVNGCRKRRFEKK